MPNASTIWLRYSSSMSPLRRVGGAANDNIPARCRTYQTCIALLDEPLRHLWCAAPFQPRVRRAERGVAGEGELAAWGEYPQPVVRLTHGRRKDERRL